MPNCSIVDSNILQKARWWKQIEIKSIKKYVSATVLTKPISYAYPLIVVWFQGKLRLNLKTLQQILLSNWKGPFPKPYELWGVEWQREEEVEKVI